MSADPKDIRSSTPEQSRHAVGERTWRFQAALPTRQVTADADRLRIISIYRARACECLERARIARDEGFVAAAHGYIDEAETWTRFADAWSSGPRIVLKVVQAPSNRLED
jgi:hypothetical protein